MKASWREVKVIAFEKYNDLKISRVVPRKRSMTVLRGRWVLTKKYDQDTMKFLMLSARWCIVGTRMNKQIYYTACDVVRLASWQLVLTVGATYRLVNFAVDLVQAFQSTPDDASKPRVYAEQMQCFEQVNADGTKPDLVQEVLVGMQGRIDGSALLSARLHAIFVDDIGMRRCENDRKVYVMYNGPMATTIDEIVAHRTAGRLDGETADGVPYGLAIVTVHADDMPSTATSTRLRDYVCAKISVHYEVKCGLWKKLLGRRVQEGEGWVSIDVIAYIERLVDAHWADSSRPRFKTISSVGIDKLTPAVVPEDPEELHLLRQMQPKARHIIGALSWASETDHRLKPISCALSAHMAQPDHTHYAAGRQALLFVHDHPWKKTFGDSGVTSLLQPAKHTWPLAEGGQEAGLHAVFDASPREVKSITGAVVMIGRAAVAVVSAREKSKTAGAHAAESSAAITVLHQLMPVRALMQELFLPQPAPTPVYTDAASVLFSSEGGAAVRHTPWLLARMGALLQAVDDKDVVLRKVTGTGNPTNSLTKYTPGHEQQRDFAYIMNRVSAQVAAAPKALDQRDDDLAGLRAMLSMLAEAAAHD